MRISVLIPCHNEEKSIRKCVESCLNQVRPLDEIIVVNDGSTDKSGEILATFGKQIKVITIPKATGNKSHAQERGLKYVTGDIFIATDGDTVLDPLFAQEIEKHFVDPKVAAVGGYIRSLKYNWLTACRAFEYTIGQNLHKLAQNYINFMFVIPGAAGAFRTGAFRKYIHFDHDTITEDLDFTFKFHRLGFKIDYCLKAVCYTQDPAKLKQYINQIRRWYGGGFQCIRKHFSLWKEPVIALELSMMYIEGLMFSLLMLILPFINLYSAAYFFGGYFIGCAVLAVLVAIKERRKDILFVPFTYILLVMINSYVLLEQFGKEVILGKKNLVWFQPERVQL
jgi:cellulose synthase/poly-beta-1,6-N-acetylglucosamine synthase-like glycosyltransferase